ncbi:hypothetical protein N0V82_009125 [Gnomoniopsis sp. IMI 355080]|nr:hypothetical protein N0V82_009125 [Gnomoniopsis sp. IMI 355080]
MNHPTPLRRNPRRIAAELPHATGPGRVTRSRSTRQRPSYDFDDPLGHSSSDQDSNDDWSDHDTFTRSSRHSHRPVAHTVASTRDRRQRHLPAQNSLEQAQARSSTARSTRSTRSNRPIRRGPSTPRKKRAGSVFKSPPKKSRQQPELPSSGITPPWQHLEWTILVQVFEFASYPLDNKANVHWLLSAGLTCKAFLDPALKALYKSAMPQLISMNVGNKYANLIRHLASEPEAALARLDHRRTMVESLVVEVSSLPHSQNPNFDIAELILSLPRLSYVELFHDFDLPPYRKLDWKTKKWTYSPELVDALRAAGDAEGALRLKSWTWSARLMTPSLIEDLQQIHGWTTFSQLRKLAFVNFQVPSLKEHKGKDSNYHALFEKDKDYINLVAASLSSVANLKHLVLESSTVVDGQFLSLLPKTIEHLEIVNCWEVTADMLSEYLITHGRTLRQLTLHNNQSLSLSFLPLLGGHCPELRELSMDLLTYSHLEFYNNSGPIYDKLLTVDDVPVWPKKIEAIELEQLAKWDAETAEMFFQSFVDQAPHLPHLRHLAVKAMLDVPWRQRSEFRDKWVRKLKKIFLHKTKKPRPYHSLVQWPLSDAGQSAEKHVQPVKAADDVETSSPRRSTRARSAPQVFTPVPPPVASKRKRSSATTTRRDLRHSKRANISYRDPDTDEDLDLEASSSQGEHQQEDPSPLSSPPASPTPAAEDDCFIHGLCDVVNIRFDNQKPREFQWGAEDFLDEQSSGSNDAEWTSDRDLDDDSDAMAW